MNLIQLVRDHWVHILVPMGFVVGCYLDRKSEEKLTAFRNKSLLFKRLVWAFLNQQPAFGSILSIIYNKNKQKGLPQGLRFK